jgi:hypothetical protein
VEKEVNTLCWRSDIFKSERREVLLIQREQYSISVNEQRNVKRRDL